MLLIILSFGILIGQQHNNYNNYNPVQGLVLDQDSKERLAQVRIRNICSKQQVYSNIQGVFVINVALYDYLVVEKNGYYADTIPIKNFDALIIRPKRLPPTLLQEVTIRDTLVNIKKRQEQLRQDYKTTYQLAERRNWLLPKISDNLSGVGLGLNIDALYHTFSRTGKNAQKLKNLIEKDYQEWLIDYNFNKSLVCKITGLTDSAQLSDFMFHYRPSYAFITQLSEYELLEYIKTSYKQYIKNLTNHCSK